MIGKPEELSRVLFNLDRDKVYEIKEYKKMRSKDANAYFHKLANELAKYNRANGFAVSDEDMKIDLNLAYGTIATDKNNSAICAIVPQGTNMREFYPYAKRYKRADMKDFYVFYKRTHELNSKEFWQLIKGVESECKQVGIKTLDDVEFERLMNSYGK